MSSEENVGSILLAPVCSNCLNIIEDTVDLRDDDIVPNQWIMKICTVEPRRCSKCGAIFKSIVAPKEFPFKFEAIHMNWMN